ncbi:hypothetical protein GLAREA_04884 [Glarea lozoyensis ATCC 20868]|uniref:2EXR domain-containing protein n=1 Tax=Glarea lozoyensis (strain ATCC 20868 / MF5171) TaxID=1116229 RepID=S3DNN9_GLAL2|nr:uncharacterized protein GLAREA_04884 [Glarea lozoyensis ATCC 20868]EPE28093.1 hypothetical protein GLAREA_04884 [Glarea lozoyensis ATCC 20868]
MSTPDAIHRVPVPNAVSSTNDAPSFTSFNKLPVELRLAVWKLTFQPRLVNIQYQKCKDTSFTSPARIPSALKVCKESRTFALPFYPLSFGSVWHPPMVRFNSAIDTLYFRAGHFLSHLFGIMTAAERNALKYIAVDSGTMFDLRPYREPGFERVLKTMPGLKELIVVHDIKSFERRQCRSASCTVLLNQIPSRLAQQPDNMLLSEEIDEQHWDLALSGSYMFPRVYGMIDCRCKNKKVIYEDFDYEPDLGYDESGYEPYDPECGGWAEESRSLFTIAYDDYSL